MSRAFTPKVITANDLLKGDVIWLSHDDHWVRALEQAELLTTPEKAQARLAYAQSQSHIAVGPYLADAQAGAGGPEATHFREIFRTRGPSNYLHGKQVDQIRKPI